MRVYHDSKGNINGYSWNISNKFIQTVVMGGCLLRVMLFPLLGLYLIFHPNEGGKYAFSRKWYYNRENEMCIFSKRNVHFLYFFRGFPARS